MSSTICFLDRGQKFTVNNTLLSTSLNVNLPALVNISYIPASWISSYFCPNPSGEVSLQAPVSDLHIQSAERRGPAGRSDVTLSSCSPFSIIEQVQCRLRQRDGPFDHSVPDPLITLPKIEQSAPLIVTEGNLNRMAALYLLLWD